MSVPHNANDLAPVVLRAYSDLLAERARGIVPVLAREFFGDHSHRNLIVDVAPGEITARDERRAKSFEKARRDELKPAKRKVTWRVGAVLCEARIDRMSTIQRDTPVEVDRGD